MQTVTIEEQQKPDVPRVRVLVLDICSSVFQLDLKLVALAERLQWVRSQPPANANANACKGQAEQPKPLHLVEMLAHLHERILSMAAFVGRIAEELDV